MHISTGFVYAYEDYGRFGEQREAIKFCDYVVHVKLEDIASIVLQLLDVGRISSIEL
jgi:hypothetical protein